MRRTNRGSAAVMAMIMVVSTMSVAIVLVTLSGAVRTKQTRLEANRVVKNAFDGGVDYVRDLASRGVLRLPQTLTLTTGNVQQSLALTDISSGSVSLLGIPIVTGVPTILINGTLTYRGQTYRQQKVIGRGLRSTVWQYAIYDDTGLSSPYFVRTGSPGLEGDAWIEGNVSLWHGWTRFGGDLTATGSILPLSIDVAGQKTSGAERISFPAAKKLDYQSVATWTVASGTSINGYVFPSADSGGYPVLYCDGDLTLSGNFSGSGVIFVANDATISGSITTGASDHVLIVADRDVEVQGAVGTIDAYLYCTRDLTISAAGTTLTSKAGIVAKNLILNRNTSFSYDPYVRDNPPGAYALKLPGVWP